MRSRRSCLGTPAHLRDLGAVTLSSGGKQHTQSCSPFSVRSSPGERGFTGPGGSACEDREQALGQPLGVAWCGRGQRRGCRDAHSSGRKPGAGSSAFLCLSGHSGSVVEHRPLNQEDSGWIPGQGTCRGCGLDPRWCRRPPIKDSLPSWMFVSRSCSLPL